ncbi:MAG: phosphoglucosamine mutase [Deltaproteobacteria bacterium]|nr:phosphoglucosamine mutase [Deltaproteobacteria bacterium]
MRKLFGTDGIRGTANIEPMTVEMAMKVGRAAGHLFKDKDRRHRIVIGKDTRLSGYMLETALCAGICSMGVDVMLLGPFPTPGIAFITSNMRADAGVVISASHNPFQDNGIKFFSPSGFKLPDAVEKEIERLIFSNGIDSIRPTAEEVGKAYRIEDAIGRYIVHLKNSIPGNIDLEGLKVVLDCANGAAYKVAPRVLTELGAQVIALNKTPDGENINRDCGSLHPDVISRAVRDNNANIGIALDGDADRAIFADEHGNVVDGDQIMALCALNMHAEGKLKKDTLVATVMSNMGLDIAMKKAGIKVLKTAVGDRHVVEEMVKGGYSLGGEQSGHMVFLDHSTTGDGTLSALQTISVMKKTGKPLSELASCMTTLPQVLLNVKVKKKRDLGEFPGISAMIAKVEKDLLDKGRVLVRFSGTEPLARVMIEGEDKQGITVMAQGIAESIERALG